MTQSTFDKHSQIYNKAGKYKLGLAIGTVGGLINLMDKITDGVSALNNDAEIDAASNAMSDTQKMIDSGFKTTPREVTHTYHVPGGEYRQYNTFESVDLKTLKAEQKVDFDNAKASFNKNMASFDPGTAAPYLLVASIGCIIANFGFRENASKLLARAEIGVVNGVKNLFKKNKGDDVKPPTPNLYSRNPEVDV